MDNKQRSFLGFLAILLVGTALSGMASAQAVVTTNPGGVSYNGITTTTGTPVTPATTTTTTTVPGALTLPTAVSTPLQQTTTQQTTAPASPQDLARYASMVGQQGAQLPGTQPQQPQQQVKYYYKATDPNDPLATVEMPEHLFNNIPAPNY